MANTLKIKRGTAATIPQGQLAEPLFTTDTYDLYIGKGSGGNQRFQKYIASGTSSQFLKGDGSLDSTTYQATSEKGQNNGYASLDAGGKIPASQLPSSVIEYKGTWDASTNTPTLADGTGDAGDVYIVSVGGTQNLGSGNITFDAGDWVMYNGSVWQKSTGSNAVASVNGQTGIVVLDTDDISEPVSPTNKWFTDARARAALSLTTTGTSGAATYDNSTGVFNIPQYQSVLTNPVTGTGTNNEIAYFNTTGSTIASLSTATYPSLTELSYVKGVTSAIQTQISGKQAQLNGTGFVKASGTTITYDNSTYLTTSSAASTYLPLAGGTLTGTLSGTSATFSSRVNVNGATDSANNALQVKADNGLNKFVFIGLDSSSIITSKISAEGYATFNSIESLNIKFKDNAAIGYDSGYTTIASDTDRLNISRSATQYFSIIYPTGLRTFTLPNASGTIALTSNLSSYLPLTGGTLTGALSGTSATFSSSVTGVTTFRVNSTGASGSAYSALLLSSPVVTWNILNDDNGGGGDLRFYNDALASDAMRIKKSNNYVGIGTNTPLFKTQIASPYAKTSATQDAVLFLGTNEASNPWGLRIKPIGAAAIANRYIEFQTTEVNIADGGSIVLQTGGGRVGIGTSSPSHLLDVQTSAVTQARFRGSSTDAAIIRLENSTSTQTYGIGAAGSANLGGAPNNSFYIRDETANAVRLAITSGGRVEMYNSVLANSPSEGATGEGLIAGRSFKIDATGTGQSAKMYVVSNTLSDTYGSAFQVQFANLANTAGFGFNINTSGGYETYVKNGSGSWERRMTITSGGNVLIGTTSDDARLTVQPSGSGYGQVINHTNATNQYFISFRYNTTTIGTITGNNTNTAYNTSGSDLTIKKNFENWTENVSNYFASINPQKFHFLNQNDNEEKVKGFIAQEMVYKFPEAYPLMDNGKYMFNPSGMVVYLMKAIQELKAEIDTLKK